MFLGCEGLSEHGYGNWLNRLAGRRGVAVAIRAENLRGGDPLDVVESAVGKLRQARRSGRKYDHRAILLDNDLLGSNPTRDSSARQLAASNNVRLIFQSPTHEGFLVRHFSGQETRQPPNVAAAEILLRSVWPNYEKGIDAIGYEKTLTLEHLRRARIVEPEFDAFLTSIGWPRGA